MLKGEFFSINIEHYLGFNGSLMLAPNISAEQSRNYTQYGWIMDYSIGKIGIFIRPARSRGL